MQGSPGRQLRELDRPCAGHSVDSAPKLSADLGALLAHFCIGHDSEGRHDSRILPSMLLGCQVAVKKKAPQSVGSHGPGVGLGFLPRLPPPSCARPVSGVGLGLSYYPASLLWSPGPRPSPVFRSAVCDCLSLNVSISLLYTTSRGRTSVLYHIVAVGTCRGEACFVARQSRFFFLSISCIGEFIG